MILYVALLVQVKHLHRLVFLKNIEFLYVLLGMLGLLAKSSISAGKKIARSIVATRMISFTFAAKRIY